MSCFYMKIPSQPPTDVILTDINNETFHANRFYPVCQSVLMGPLGSLDCIALYKEGKLGTSWQLF